MEVGVKERPDRSGMGPAVVAAVLVFGGSAAFLLGHAITAVVMVGAGGAIGVFAMRAGGPPSVRLSRVAVALSIAFAAACCAFIGALAALFAFYPLCWDECEASQPEPGWGVAFMVLTLAILVGGLWCAGRVATGSWRLLPRQEPRPDSSLTDRSRGTAPVFVPCPRCGMVLNQEVGRCPYCRTDLAAAGEQDGAEARS